MAYSPTTLLHVYLDANLNQSFIRFPLGQRGGIGVPLPRNPRVDLKEQLLRSIKIYPANAVPSLFSPISARQLKRNCP